MVKIYSLITVLILSLSSFAEDLPLSKSIQKLSTNIEIDDIGKNHEPFAYAKSAALTILVF